ncbi:peptidoglycan DD-metalloendopeptidase family protein, partial [Lutimaribacter sp. EGI FJ00014]|nr:peptidoglycan DD-metalloendopeptidase family protein [Lutimaribacter sp. EGI FJ00014]
AIYSAAARNNVPTGVIGEAIMYLSRGEDLNAFATESDRLALVYSQTARGDDGVSGRVLYVGVHGAQRSLECFVFRQDDGNYACITREDQIHSLTVTNGMVTPVNGVLTSTFGPRKHPILKTVRIHKGVDWMAPVGTPVFAAFDGKITFQGNGGGYGNLVRIAHPDGRETRYAHLQRFNLKNSVGTAVKAGEVIGYVGTTGLSTGPHLHFELYQAGSAVDPLGTGTAVASDDSAVEALTARIIQVESGGDIRAKNPKSSATGLGQFIERTWVRMMNTYR